MRIFMFVHFRGLTWILKHIVKWFITRSTCRLERGRGLLAGVGADHLPRGGAGHPAVLLQGETAGAGVGHQPEGIDLDLDHMSRG